MKISQRLLTIANNIKPGSIVADIGADHGILSNYIIKNNIAKRVFAVENKVGPYSILSKSVDNKPNIEVSLSDGISKIPEDVDTVVIAGMGGHLITTILQKDSRNLENVKYIIVDAHRDLEFLRREITKLGYKMTLETLVKERLYYHIIVFEKGLAQHSDIDYEFGYHISTCSLFNEYRDNFIKRLTNNYNRNHDEKLLHQIERIKQL